MARLSQIEFQLVDDRTGAYGPDISQGVEVIIDGVALRRIWLRETGEETLPLRVDYVVWPGHSLWRNDPPLGSPANQASDRRTVLVDTDGLDDSGGASAKFQFEPSRVRWSDFHTADGRAVGIGPFEFDGQKYHQALKELEQSWRRAG
jgi:hypothetical protein